MKRMIVIFLALAFAAGGVTVVSAAVSGENASSNVSENVNATPVGADISGPCDEAEHANDPRCSTGRGIDGRGRDFDSVAHNRRGRDHAEDDVIGAQAPMTDISGPCDEAEHASDPRCTGVSTARAEDRDDDVAEAGDDRGRDEDSGEHGDDDSGEYEDD